MSEADVLAPCRGPLARYKCPTPIDSMAAIPRNPFRRTLTCQVLEPYSMDMVYRVP